MLAEPRERLSQLAFSKDAMYINNTSNTRMGYSTFDLSGVQVVETGRRLKRIALV